jgi:hypothetical protein
LVIEKEVPKNTMSLCVVVGCGRRVSAKSVAPCATDYSKTEAKQYAVIRARTFDDISLDLKKTVVTDFEGEEKSVGRERRKIDGRLWI